MSKRARTSGATDGKASKASKAGRHAIDHGQEGVKGIDHPTGVMSKLLVSKTYKLLT